jgi:hypothetical protein
MFVISGPGVSPVRILSVTTLLYYAGVRKSIKLYKNLYKFALSTYTYRMRNDLN